MRRSSFHARLVLPVAALALLILGLTGSHSVWAQGSAPAFQPRVENDFPRALVFELQVTGDHPFIDARVYFRPVGTAAWNSAPVPVETPSTDVRLRYEWFTKNATIPPGLLIEYYWRLEDETGQSFTTPHYQTEYLDVRFDWQRVEGEKLTVLWYAGDRAWGEAMFRVGEAAIERLEETFGVTFEQPVRVVVYANGEDFRSAFPPQQSWIGGQAFPEMGITVQIIAPGDRDWMEQVIPHEVAHLAFARATESALAIPPAWLNEGLAMYSEPGEFGEAQRERLREAARAGTLPPLSRLQGNFGADHSTVSLAYLESWALVDFLLRDCGQDGFRRLIEGLNAGLSMDEALESACGYDQEQFYARWLTEELGVTPPTQAPEVRPTLPPLEPTPEPAPVEQSSQGKTGERTALLAGLLVLGAGTGCTALALLVLAAAVAVAVWRK